MMAQTFLTQLQLSTLESAEDRGLMLGPVLPRSNHRRPLPPERMRTYTLSPKQRWHPQVAQPWRRELINLRKMWTSTWPMATMVM